MSSPPSPEEIIQQFGSHVPEKTEFEMLWKILSPADQFERFGVAVVNVFSPEECTQTRNLYIRASKKFSGYNPGVTQFSAGGFGALGNAESFHTQTARRTREEIFNRVTREIFGPLLAKYPLDFPTRIQCLTGDRFMWRKKGQAPGAEQWHADVTPAKFLDASNQARDLLCGGFTNLNSDLTHYFTCLPGSHIGFTSLSLEKSGFSKIPERFHPYCNANSARIPVLPGQHVIFPQYLRHTITSNKAPEDMFRQFCSFRVTDDPEPLFGEDEVAEFLNNFAVPRLPSYQRPAIYSAYHLTRLKNTEIIYDPSEPRFKYTLSGWCKKTFAPEMFRLLGPEKNEVVPRFLPSQRELHERLNKIKDGKETYPLPLPYTPEQAVIYRPRPIVHCL